MTKTESPREASIRIAKTALSIVSKAKITLRNAPEAYEAMQWLEAIVQSFEAETPPVPEE